MSSHRVAEQLAKLTGAALAAAVTAVLLAGVGGMADRQYESAWLAQAAAHPITVAQNEAPAR